MALLEILYRFKPDGTLAGHHARDWADDGKRSGPVRRLTAEDLAAIDTTLDAAYLGRIAELEAELAQVKADHAAEIAAMREAEAGQQTQYKALSEIYNTMSAPDQIAFSGELVVILGLIDRGRADLAAGRLAALQVPEHLTASKTAMLAAISGD